jgi:hypothetical protein
LRGKQFVKPLRGYACLSQGCVLSTELDEPLSEAFLLQLAAALDEGFEEATGGAVGDDAFVESVHEVGEDVVEAGLVGVADDIVIAAPEVGVLGAGGREGGVRVAGLGAEGARFEGVGGVVAAESGGTAGEAAAGPAVRKDVVAAKHGASEVAVAGSR